MSDIRVDNSMGNKRALQTNYLPDIIRISNSPKSLWGIVTGNLESHLKGSHHV
jgi:hypothetical protein